MATKIGFVKAIIGEVTATSADGGVRTLQAGDRIFANDLISTGPGGAVEIEFSDGSVMDLGRDSQALLDNSVFNPDTAATAELGEEAVPDDIAAIQQALLEGEDPTQVGEATAAGAGVEAGNEGHEPVFVDYLNPAIIPDAGFDTVGVTNTYDLPEEDIIIVEEEAPLPTVGVSVEVEIEIDPENPPPDDGVPNEDYPLLVSGNGAIVLEGTNGGEPREVTFLLKLSAVSAQDVEVTYQLRPLTADHPDDWFNGSLIQTVTIPAGTQVIPVTVMIVQDHLDESNEQFDIVLLSATNATINPDADSAIVTIYDDDTTPVAQDDFDNVAEDDFGEDELVSTSGNVISGINDDGDNVPADQEDTDEDGDLLTIVSFSDANETAAPGGMITGEYGTLTMDENGEYTYILTSNDDPVIQGLSEGDTLTDVFTYVVTDTYNTPQTATLTIIIQGADDGVTITGLDGEGAEEEVYEANLIDGSSPDENALMQDGSFSFSAPDGFGETGYLSIGGQVFTLAQLQALADSNETVSSDFGDLLLTDFSGDEFGGTISYKYTLTNNVDNDDEEGASDGSFTDSFEVIVTDDDGSSDTASLDVLIIDDVPTIVSVPNAVVGLSDPVASGQINFIPGADGVGSFDLSGNTPPEGADYSYETYTFGDDLPDGVVLTEGEALLIATWDAGDDAGETYFTLHVDVAGEYTFEVVTPPAGEPITFDVQSVNPGNFPNGVWYDSDTGNWGSDTGSINGDVDLATEAEVKITSSQGVNSSGAGTGFGNNHLEENEDVTFDFLDNGQQATTPYATIDTVRNAGGGALLIAYTAYGYDAMGDPDFETGYLYFDNATFETATVEIPGFEFYRLVLVGQEAGVSVDASEIDNVDVPGSYSSTDGAKLTIGEVTFNAGINNVDQDFDFDVDLIDGDGDVSNTGQFSVHVEGDDTTAGGGFELVGTTEADILISSTGDDVLTGDTGADTFEFSMAENTGNDQITDFEIGVDSLSFKDVIDGGDVGTDISLGDAVSAVNDDGTDVTLTLTNGGSVTITGIGNGSVNDVASLQTLIGADKINVDAS